MKEEMVEKKEGKKSSKIKRKKNALVDSIPRKNCPCLEYP